MPVGTLIVIAVVGALGGVVAALAYRRARLSQTAASLPSPERELRARTQSLALEKRARAQDHAQRWREERRARQEALNEKRRSLGTEEARLRDREHALEERHARAETRGEQYDEAKGELRALQESLAKLQGDWLAALETRAAQGRESLLELIVDERVTAAHAEIDSERQRELQALEERATMRARELLTTVTQRYDGESHLERISNSFSVPPDLAERLGAAQSPSGKAFVESTGCSAMASADGSTLTIRGDDPLGREHARRLLRRLLHDGRSEPDAIRAEGERIGRALQREVQNAGRRAVKRVGLTDVAPEIVGLLGRLKFRLSFSQNQWKHSIEVAHLTRLLTAELKGEAVAAKRAGLMHDMGKALTHEREGAHAIIGAEIAERCGEAEAVRHAIGAHHYDEPPSTALAFSVITADAMSGARPGARRESTTQYTERIRDIETIATREPGVLRVDVMQGGREVRVVVAGTETGAIESHQREYDGAPPLPDDQVHPLAQRIARAIEDQIRFAGQIRVTVIRESRAVSVAR